MDNGEILPKVAMHMSGGCLVVPIQIELQDPVLNIMQAEILERVRATGTRAIVIDVAGVAIIDMVIAEGLCDTVLMAALLGATTVLTGLSPGVVSALTDLGFDGRNLLTAVSFDAAVQLLAHKVSIDAN